MSDADAARWLQKLVADISTAFESGDSKPSIPLWRVQSFTTQLLMAVNKIYHSDDPQTAYREHVRPAALALLKASNITFDPEAFMTRADAELGV